MKDAVSFRTRKTSIYDKKSNTPFKISRSKFFNFLSCKRCFYLDRVKGLKEPSMPGWALNVAVDELLKKEFDQYRKEQKPHPIMIKHKLNFVPYKHKDLDVWRNSFKGVGQPLRIALVGSRFGPGLYDVILSLDKAEVLKRLKQI